MRILKQLREHSKKNSSAYQITAPVTAIKYECNEKGDIVRSYEVLHSDN